MTGKRTALSTALTTAAVILVALLTSRPAAAQAQWRLVGYNNLGMHCMDSDYSVFSVLPPYNTIHAQLVDNTGHLVKDPASLGITVTYQAVADSTGSINTTSVGKTGFWTYLPFLFGGLVLPVDQGLALNWMPGTANVPKVMTWDGTNLWWIALGVPITPWDDAGHKNAYPMFRLVAKNSSGTVLATTDIVLPVSDEMDCRACHASGTSAAARPNNGWAWSPVSEKDYRLNILLKHDDRFAATATYKNAAQAVGLSPDGLFPSVTAHGQSIMCANCHSSEALGTASQPGVKPLTTSMHLLHAAVTDPTNGQPMDSSANRTACYRCHPGAATKCLRGVMGNSVAADGTMAMQCQSCHGTMSQVADTIRTGWLSEPRCDSCHSGTATSNNGQIEYTNVYDTPNHQRQAVNATFATNDNVPMAPYSLFRFSHGHGSLACESCHGSTHAEFPSSHTNDNVQSTTIQGHVGMLVECDKCHAGAQPSTVTGGPHGMHPVGQTWVSGHKSAAQSNRTQCRLCHGTDYRGTILSRSQANRSLSAFGTKAFWRGFQVGCYTCHQGPTNDNANSNHAAVTTGGTISTPANTPVSATLTATDADGNTLTRRIVSQPAHGTVALTGTQATYYPDQDYVGADTFTWAAWDGSTDSNLATMTVTVAASTCSLSCDASGPGTGSLSAALPFTASAAAPGCTDAVTFEWDFGDGQPHDSSQSPAHAYATSDTFLWTMTARAGSASCVKTGTLRVTGATPTGVPSYLAGLKAAKAGGGQDATITWDAANCPAPNYQILYGYGTGLASATVSGSQCAIGASGSYTWTGVPDPTTDASRLLWFVVVGTDAAGTEGSWGQTSSGAERGGAVASNACGTTAKDLTAVCAAP